MMIRISGEGRWFVKPLGPLVVALSLACGDSAILRGSHGGGDTLVTRVAAEPTLGNGVLHLVLTLGHPPADTSARFTRVADIWLSTRGSVYVVDRWAEGTSTGGSVRKYDGGGHLLATFGRVGDGPGEFRTPGGVRELGDGTVAVSAAGKIVLFDSAGSLLRELPGAAGYGNTAPRLLLDDAGVFHLRLRIGEGIESLGGRPRRVSGVASFVRVDPRGGVTDTLTAPFEGVVQPHMLERNLSVPFVPRHVWAWSPAGYFVTAHTATYAVDLRYSPSTPRRSPFSWREGDRVVSLRRTGVQGIPVIPQERRDHAAAIEAFMRSGGGPADWTLEVGIPDRKPPVRDLTVAEDGRIWVRVHTEATLNPSVPAGSASVQSVRGERWPEADAYDVLDANGAYLGNVRFPVRVELATIRGDTIWAVTRGSNDVPLVSRYQVVWSRPP
jgi:hypothetical protein